MTNFIVFISCPIAFISLCLAAEEHQDHASILYAVAFATFIGCGIYLRNKLDENFWN